MTLAWATDRLIPAATKTARNNGASCRIDQHFMMMKRMTPNCPEYKPPPRSSDCILLSFGGLKNALVPLDEPALCGRSRLGGHPNANRIVSNISVGAGPEAVNGLIWFGNTEQRRPRRRLRRFPAIPLPSHRPAPESKRPA